MLDLTKQALEMLTQAILIPAVAKTGEVDEYVRDMKRAIVEFVVEHYQTPKEVLARHFGKSDRWVYRQLEDALKARQEESPTKGPAHDGQRLLIDVINFFQERFPAGATAGECARALKDKGWPLNGVELGPILTLYVAMGYLEEIRNGGEAHRFRVHARDLTHVAKDRNERLALLKRHSEALLPIAISYLRGDEGSRFSLSQAAVLPQHFIEAMRDIRQFQISRIMKAVESSLKEDPEELQPRVTFASLLLSGALVTDGIHAPVAPGPGTHSP